MKSTLKAILPRRLWEALGSARQRWFQNYARDSFSQEGEDLILERFLEGRENGFYVDIGAHHPFRFSNTYRLYRRGWRGLNVDANPGSMAIFRRMRPRDINVEAAVSAQERELTFHVFNDPALNTFDRELAMGRVSPAYSIVEEVVLRTQPLWKLLDQYVPADTEIDLMTVDVEGLDYEVLSSNDWQRYRPQYLIVERLDLLTVDGVTGDPIQQLLAAQHYSMVAKTMNSLIFRRGQ
jgi:FkbM family methyltransferase